jgi:hypothetical protein
MRVGKVFVPGGQPVVTYIAREDLQLEEQVTDYIDERHRFLSLAGPTKAGKTVLVRRVIPNAIWLHGGNIRSLDGFWESIVDKLAAFPTETKERTGEDVTSDEYSAAAGLKIGVEAGGEYRRSDEKTSGKRQAFTRTRGDEMLALEKLGSAERVLVIDDFHYIPSDLQSAIVRGLKAAVFEGLAVVFVAVPHRAFDAVRVEEEMSGRVEHVQIPFWSWDELEAIGSRGFQALNLSVPTREVQQMVRHAFGSPHLMQDLCLQFCNLNEQESVVPLLPRASSQYTSGNI